MDIPDFMGMALESVSPELKVLETWMQVRIVPYQAPPRKNRDNGNDRSHGPIGQERIVRQRLLEDNTLELVVSVFREVPEGSD